MDISAEEARLRGYFDKKNKKSTGRKTEEDNLQVACRRWFDMKYPLITQLFFMVKNDGRKSKWQGQKDKDRGLRAGVPDMILSIPMGGYHGLYIEYKKPKGGVQSPDQKCFEDIAKQHGYRYEIIKTKQDFEQLITTYLHGYTFQPSEIQKRRLGSNWDSALFPENGY